MEFIAQQAGQVNRKSDKAAEGQKIKGGQNPGKRFAREHASGIRSRERLGEQRQRSVEHPERDEDADADEGN